MTQVEKKIVEDKQGLASGLDFGTARRYTEYLEEPRKLESRRAGVLLIIVGCVLMALTAGDALAGDREGEQEGKPEANIEASAVLRP